MEIAQVVSYKVIPANSHYEKGIKGRSSATFIKKGHIHERNGFGGVWIKSPTRIILTVLLNGESYDVSVDGMFREEFERLTEKRVAAICKTIPQFVTLERHVGFKGNIWFTLTTECFYTWFRNLSV